ncbi:hypothetical protein ES708_21898 [subsurface metagenome]
MTEKNKQLEQQLWNIANTLRGKMGATTRTSHGMLTPLKKKNRLIL